MENQDPKIIDVTIRRGGFLVHNKLLKEQVVDIAKGLRDAGVSYVELSHGRGVGAKRAGYPALFSDQDLLEAAQAAAPELKFTAFMSPYPYSLFEAERIQKFVEWFRLSIDLDEVEKGAENLKALRKTGGKVMALLERAHRVSPKDCAEAAKAMEAAGAEAIYLCDNFSSMSGEDVKTYLGALRGATSLPLGFQGYNATGQAVGNALAALQSGAEWLDASLLGLGPSGGMVPLEVLAALLQRLGKGKSLNLQRLCRAGRWFALPAVRRLPMSNALDYLMSAHKLDYYPLDLLEMLAGIVEIDPRRLVEELDAQNPGRIRLKENDIREFLARHQLDFDVVMEFLKTGEIPGQEAASPS